MGHFGQWFSYKSFARASTYILMELSIDSPGIALAGLSKFNTSDLNQCIYLSEEKGKNTLN